MKKCEFICYVNLRMLIFENKMASPFGGTMKQRILCSAIYLCAGSTDRAIEYFFPFVGAEVRLQKINPQFGSKFHQGEYKSLTIYEEEAAHPIVKLLALSKVLLAVFNFACRGKHLSKCALSGRGDRHATCFVERALLYLVNTRR